MSKKGSVLVGISGGIDSSMTALLLHEQGYKVSTITLRVWDYMSAGCNMKNSGCCSVDDMYAAKEFSEKAGFDHYIDDVRADFDKVVVTNFVNEYMKGGTPNPCVMCNPNIKWKYMLHKANELGCDYVATGHYAQSRSENGRHILCKAVDENKDQTYFLWALNQEYLSRTLFPLGGMTKSQVRDLATDRGFVKLAKKRESQEVCFIPDNDYREFLRRRTPDIDEKVKGGVFVSTDGKILGEHEGFPFYTIGQRKGLKIALGKPMYVVDIDASTNRIVLGEEKDLASIKMQVGRLNLIKYAEIPAEIEVQTKIRYRHHPKQSLFRMIDNDKAEVIFNEEINSITAGQSAVFYQDNDVVGGGIIIKRSKE
jgi:tRNA-uridine 2-sulfurtransferase